MRTAQKGSREEVKGERERGREIGKEEERVSRAKEGRLEVILR